MQVSVVQFRPWAPARRAKNLPNSTSEDFPRKTVRIVGYHGGTACCEAADFGMCPLAAPSVAVAA